MNKSPAFQWYPKDILASARVAEMSLAEEGAYRRLLDFCWINGSVPADEKRCARLIGKGATPEIARIALDMFVPDPTDPERMVHERLELEREKQERNSEARRLASEARWSKRGTSNNALGKQAKSPADANALQMESSSSSTSIASSSSPSVKKGEGAKSPPPVISEEELQSLAVAVQQVTGLKASGWQSEGAIRSAAIELHGQGFTSDELLWVAGTLGKTYKCKHIVDDVVADRQRLKQGGNLGRTSGKATDANRNNAGDAAKSPSAQHWKSGREL